MSDVDSGVAQARERYFEDMERQLGMWGREGQERLRGAAVAVGGIGGIGAISSLMLAKAGIGRIILCDRDVYEGANIVEQAFASYDTLGRKKVEAAREEMERHSRSSEVATFTADLSDLARARDLVESADLLISGVDNAAARIALGRACYEKGIPMVVSANVGWCILHTVYLAGGDGYAAVWRDVPGLCWSAGFPDLDEPSTRAAVEQEWDIWVVAMAGFQPEFLEEYLEGDRSYLWYAAPPAYAAASLGVMDCFKILSGIGSPTVFPETLYLDLKTNLSPSWNEFTARREALRKAWGQGTQRVVALAKEWS